jgi:riboflavin kinase / FMN adenylyltransferase
VLEVEIVLMDVFVGVNGITRTFKNPVITIGNFDGVHYGHQVLFRNVKNWARQLHGEALVMTFHPHPLEVLFPGKGPARITTHERKLELIAENDMDAVIVIPFTKEFARISARSFVEDLLVGKIGIKGIVVGYDYRFGREREGNIDYLQEMGSEFGFEVRTLSGIMMEEAVVSSTAVRQLIQEGNIPEINKLLGRSYDISGPVITGRGRGGRLIGFPTANIRMSDQSPLRPGVYVVQVEGDGKTYGGAANMGYNPTFGDTPFSLEVHILDFDRDIYGETITVRFRERLRDEQRFSSVDELIAQIKKDVDMTREILAGS